MTELPFDGEDAEDSHTLPCRHPTGDSSLTSQGYVFCPSCGGPLLLVRNDDCLVLVSDLKVVLGTVRPESPDAARAYQRLAEAVAHAEGQSAPWEER